MRGAILVLLILGTLAAGRVGADPPIPAEAERIQALIEQLGSDSFERREQATKQLQDIGSAALPALRHALKSTADLEVVRRVRLLLRPLEDQELAAKVLAPRRLRLTLKEARVPEAVAQLAKASGYPIHLSDEAARSDRKVTLATGETTFWDALGRLCKAAELVENASLMGPFDARGVLPADERVREVIGAAPGIHLTGGKQVEVPAVVVGSLRLRLIQVVAAPRQAIDLVLEVSAEPRLSGLEPVGGLKITRASDDQGHGLEQTAGDNTPPSPDRQWSSRLLGHRGGGWVLVLLDGTILKGNSFVAAPPVAQGPFLVRARLRWSGTKATMLKELTGSVTLQTLVESDSPLVIDKILEAAGREPEGRARGADGATLTVQQVERLANKDVRVQVMWKQRTGVNGVGWRGQIGGKAGSVLGGIEVGGVEGDRSPAPLAGAPRLLDADGSSWTLTEWASQRWTVTATDMAHRITLVYRPGPGQRTPARLVLAGQRAFALAVPFTFKNVPLP